MKIGTPELGRLTQGTIFSCAYAERYEGSCVHGIVITARCDLAQDKFPILNFIPIVAFDDWIRKDGFEIAYARAEKSAAAEQSSLLKEWMLSESLLLGNSIERIVDVYTSGLEGRAQKKARERGGSVVKKMAALASLPTEDIVGLSSIDSKAVDSVVRDVMTHKASGHYFFSTTAPDEGQNCYVGLLREASFLPRDLAIAVAGGIGRQSPDMYKNPLWDRWVRFHDDDDMAMPIGQLLSPDIEHLMQTFGLLFGRIGLADTPQEYIDIFCRRAKGV